MASKFKYQMYRAGIRLPQHQSNDLNELVARVEQLSGVLGHGYVIKDVLGAEVWSSEEEKSGLLGQ